MELLGDSNQEIINNLSCEDIINLKKSGEINNLSDNKLRELLSKKFLDKMVKQYSETEYPNEDVFSDKEINSLILRFCFSSLLQEFGYDRTIIRTNLSNDFYSNSRTIRENK